MVWRTWYGTNRIHGIIILILLAQLVAHDARIGLSKIRVTKVKIRYICVSNKLKANIGFEERDDEETRYLL